MEAAFQQGFASALLEVIFDKIATPALKEICLILGVDGELRKLERTLLKIQALIDHVEGSDYANNKVWQALLEDLRGLSYAADDLLDEMSMELSRCHVDTSSDNQVLVTVLSSFKLNKPKQISKLNKDMEDIAREMDILFMTQLVKSRRPTQHIKRYSSSMVEERFLIGRAEDKLEIITMLLAEDPESNVSVIPIVGMGGIGKTTLAQIVYNSTEVMDNFELRIWVSVSQEFDVIKIMKSIIESVTGSGWKLLDLDPIQKKVHDLLAWRKFLLVLDDLWNENYDSWDVLRSSFSHGARYSKVLVTSRSKIVSSIVGTTAPYYLRSLSNGECWEVMKQRAFSKENLDGQENLQLIGMQIAEKCKGLPLAAKTLGSVLRFKYTEEEWNDVLTSDLWDLPQDKNEIFPALLLSYHHLPTYLKICFYYCSIFPQNHDYEKEDLVLLWMAEGFIHPVGERRLEDIGCDYFNDLMWRCFFEYSHDNIHGQPIYKMHAIIHNVAQFVSVGICFRIVDDMSCRFSLSRNARHLSLSQYNIHQISLNTFPVYKSLRTFLVMCQTGACISDVPCDVFLKMRCLRVLDLSCIVINELPDFIDHLIHLRYLNLSENRFQMLPESIGNLFFLQTLKLKNCFQLLELPMNFKNLTNLRHLDLDIRRQLHYMPSEFGRLVNLQTLNAFIVGKKMEYRIGQLKNMKFLRGAICITGLENVLNKTQAEEAELDKKPYLDKVELRWESYTERVVGEEVLAGLLPHKNLKELVVTKYGGKIFPSWLSDPNLCNLVNIHLLECRPCTVLPAFGQLPCLKSLLIEDMHGLEQVNRHFSGFNGMGFPSLEILKFSDMPNLTTWTDFNANDMPRLCEITIVNCPRLTILPSLHNLNSLIKFDLSHCSEVQSLPMEGMPTSLITLIITDCAILRQRCMNEEGDDWSKIQSIPEVIIDFVAIPTQASII